jgi:RimJ/RimL family protein N-acetyltransferase
VDGWRGTLCPGEVRSAPSAWFAPGGPGARRAAVFAGPQPTLAAGGVTLRELADHDVDQIRITCADPETSRWTDIPVPYTVADALAAVRNRAPELWRRGEAVAFGIADPDGGYAGSIDLRISEEDRGAASVSFLIAPHARGRGYATDAVRAVCDWGFAALGLTRIVWRAYLGNTASRRVAEKAGFTMEGIQYAGCTQRGERRDAWVAALLAAPVAGGPATTWSG